MRKRDRRVLKPLRMAPHRHRVHVPAGMSIPRGARLTHTHEVRYEDGKPAGVKRHSHRIPPVKGRATRGPPTKMEFTHEHEVYYKDTGKPAGKRPHTHRIGKKELPHEVKRKRQPRRHLY